MEARNEYDVEIIMFEHNGPYLACPLFHIGSKQQYPASGLLLKRDFRSFEQGEEDGERVYTSVDPLVRDLSNFGLSDSDGTKNMQLNETLVMRVTVPPHSQSWGVNICPKLHSNFEEVLFHFNPRRRFVAMNNRDDNIWGQQVFWVWRVSYNADTRRKASCLG